MSSATIPSSCRRLLAALLPALLGQGDFAPGRSSGQKALAGLGLGLCRWLEKNPRIVFVGGNPSDPLSCSVTGLTDDLFDPTLVVDDDSRHDVQLRFSGFWSDRRLALVCLRQGLTTAEFNHFYHLLMHHAGKGLLLRNRLFEEQARGHLPNVSLIFLDDLPDADASFPWSARVSLGWIHRDLNLLSRAKGLSTRDQLDWREQLLSASLAQAHLSGALADFFSHIDLIAEEIDNYNKDELVFSLLEHVEGLSGDLCLQLCARLDQLPQGEDQEDDLPVKERRTAIKWISRRLAEQLMEEGKAGPEHLHALVLHKVLLYEEIPRQMRPRVASLQVLTSFLADPQKYFSEVESSHSPEVLATRLWRILEMLPKLIQALRFDVARQVLEFSQRFGPTFDLQAKPEIMKPLVEAAAGVFTETQSEHQSALMQTLPQMGRAGVLLLIDLADHQNRSVRRSSIDELIKVGQPVIPILFDILPTKKGWHYLRNMLLILAQLKAGGPRVENLLRKSLVHPEANVRKEALPGIAKLMGPGAEDLVCHALADDDLEVKKRAAACLGLTGITDQNVYNILAKMLSAKNCSDEFAVQIVTSINRLKPQPPRDQTLEVALLGLLGSRGFLGVGGRKASSSQTLRVAVVQALGFVGTSRSKKALTKLPSDQSDVMRKALDEAQKRFVDRSI